jgi:hypothetical protein
MNISPKSSNGLTQVSRADRELQAWLDTPFDYFQDYAYILGYAKFSDEDKFQLAVRVRFKKKDDDDKPQAIGTIPLMEAGPETRKAAIWHLPLLLCQVYDRRAPSEPADRETEAREEWKWTPPARETEAREKPVETRTAPIPREISPPRKSTVEVVNYGFPDRPVLVARERTAKTRHTKHDKAGKTIN